MHQSQWLFLSLPTFTITIAAIGKATHVLLILTISCQISEFSVPLLLQDAHSFEIVGQNHALEQ